MKCKYERKTMFFRNELKLFFRVKIVFALYLSHDVAP